MHKFIFASVILSLAGLCKAEDFTGKIASITCMNIANTTDGWGGECRVVFNSNLGTKNAWVSASDKGIQPLLLTAVSTGLSLAVDTYDGSNIKFGYKMINTVQLLAQ